MPGVAVSLKHVTKRFGARVAVNALTLEVAEGSTIGILGPSGGGKTTVLRLIAGLETPDVGEVYVGGQLASSSHRVHVRPSDRNIGFVFQDLALWPHMTVGGNLRFVLESQRWPAGSRDQRIDEMLELVGMRDRVTEYPGHLSGGEQQRVALARALVAKPALLLLDEPLSSLDADLRTQLRDELSVIPRKLGVTMIYVTHDRSDVDAFGGTHIVLSR
jgi:iron(III) transport system ATP-binding protein